MTTKPNEPARTSSVFVALVGRPNVGKSSLTNRLVGEKVAIVTQKPQTTRNRIMGIVTKGPVQFVLMDTPGIHKPRNKLDARMTQTASASLADVDVTLMLFEPAGDFTESELKMVEALKKAGPAVGIVNKVDLLSDFAALEARRRQVEEFGVFDKVLTLSAMEGTGCDALFDVLAPYGSPGPHYFDDDAYTDLPEKELVAELVREKALLFLREEVPHGIAVKKEPQGHGDRQRRPDAEKDRHRRPPGLRGAAGNKGQPAMLGQSAGRLARQRAPAGQFGICQTLTAYSAGAMPPSAVR